MKKAIIIIFCILTCNFFSVSYTLTSHKYFNHIVYAEKELPGFYSIQIPHDIMNNDSTQILHTVENCLDKYQGNLFITKNKNNHYKKYVFLHFPAPSLRGHKYIIKLNPKLKSTKTLVCISI